MTTDPHEIETYGEPGISTAHEPIPKWLIWTYILVPIWCIIWFFLFWNGSWGWLDRGYWEQLQRAANTTFPFENAIEVESNPH